MDLGAGLADFAVHALWLQAGAMIALALALAAAVARARRQTEARAARIAAENEALRDELWRLKEAAGARDRAEAASEAKSRFLATMSHEIRTPISGILGMADLLREASLDLENASYVEAIRSSGSALIALIDEILDLAKIEAGRFDLVVETVDLRRLTEGVVELLAPRAQSKGIEIAASFSAAAPRFVRADGLRLRQVLTNLAGNAVKFTDQGGVCVTVERGEVGVARFSVIDTGPGVPGRSPGGDLREFRAGRRLARAPLRGRGARARDLARACPPHGRRTDACRQSRRRVDLRFRGPAAGMRRGRPPLRAIEDETARPRRDASPYHRRFAVRGAGHGSAARRGGRKRGPRPRSQVRPRSVERARRSRTSSLSIARLGPEATNRLAQAAREAGVRRSLVLFSPFERRAFGQTALKGFDGWLVKPVRARSLFERVASDFPPAEAPAPRLSPSSAPARRALVAEDNDINALITQKALRRLGFEVVRALDGEEAVRLASPIAPLESRPFDVILMDLKMPGLDGYEATRRLRRLEAACGWSPTPIVALTANAFDERRGSPSAAGFDAFLVKPVEFRALAGTVERVCAAHAAPSRERLRAS